MTRLNCNVCGGERWVCEAHSNKPWNDKGCQCAAGVPCPKCNMPENGDTPDMPPGFVEMRYLN